MRRLFLLFIALVSLAVLLFGCAEKGKGAVGVSMPTINKQRWIQDGEYIGHSLKSNGYKVMLEYANDKPEQQSAQIAEMINAGCKCLIVAPVNGSALNDVMELAKQKKVKVIAYDRLIMNTDALTAYVTFDNVEVGRMMARYIVAHIKNRAKGRSGYMEIFSGDPDDNNCKMLYEGAMEVFNPYIENKSIVIKSYQSTLKDTATPKWSSEYAEKRMLNLLHRFYAYDEPLDAIFSMSDILSVGIHRALATKYNNLYPILTGQDCDLANVKLILKEKQAMSVFKDTRILAMEAAQMADAAINGKQLNVNDFNSYNNGVMDVPSNLCKPMVVDIRNYRKILLDSKYYTKEEVEKGELLVNKEEDDKH